MRYIVLFLICIVQWEYVYTQEVQLSISDKKNFMTYKTGCIILTRDNEQSVYQSFSIDVPKLKNKHCLSELPYLHVFLYKKKQGILIKINSEDKSDNSINLPEVQDSSYVLSKDDVKRLLDVINSEYLFGYITDTYEPRWKKVQSRLKIMEKNINKNNTRRRNLIVETKGVIILLFNIKDRNYDEYERLVQSFAFEGCSSPPISGI